MDKKIDEDLNERAKELAGIDNDIPGGYTAEQKTLWNRIALFAQEEAHKWKVRFSSEAEENGRHMIELLKERQLADDLIVYVTHQAACNPDSQSPNWCECELAPVLEAHRRRRTEQSEDRKAREK